jgi:16S rRNA (adenine1518-N6/adenine1519-N6)-dimethyltransferase
VSAIDDLPPLREIIREHSLSARKSLGQNFLLDLNLTARIARAAGPLEDTTVVEIGPGPGGLTRALLALGARRVIAIERDARALPVLEYISKRYPGRLDIVHGDAQRFDPRAMLGGEKAKIVANLPYNIATALLVDWLSIERRGLWAVGRALQLAYRDQDPVRYLARGVRAATEGHLVGGTIGAARRP